MDFITEYYSRLHLSYNTNYDVNNLIVYFNKQYPGIEKYPVGLVYGAKNDKAKYSI